ncbi:MerR family transcriptional regulator [Neobacillus sp. Marseille-QA0830]
MKKEGKYFTASQAAPLINNTITPALLRYYAHELEMQGHIFQKTSGSNGHRRYTEDDIQLLKALINDKKKGGGTETLDERAGDHPMDTEEKENTVNHFLNLEEAFHHYFSNEISFLKNEIEQDEKNLNDKKQKLEEKIKLYEGVKKEFEEKKQ